MMICWVVTTRKHVELVDVDLAHLPFTTSA